MDFDNIRQLIGKGKSENALQRLLRMVEDGEWKNRQTRDDIIILSSQLEELKRKENIGLIKDEDSRMAHTEINNAMLKIIQKLESGEVGKPVKKRLQPVDQSGSKFPAWLIGLLFLLLAGVGLLYFFEFRQSPPDEGASGTPTLTVDRKADLEIAGHQMSPETPVQGEKVALQFIVKNKGDKDAGPFAVEWWAGVNYPEPAYRKRLSGLKAGKQKTLSFQYDGYPSWYGRITSKFVVDSQNEVTESNESNNTIEQTYAVKKNIVTPQKADLIIDAFQMSPETPTRGQRVNMQTVIKNTGNKDSGPFTIEWWAGENYPQPAYSERIRNLAAGGRKVLSFRYDGYPSWYGRITSKLVVDTKNQVAESNEENNTLKKTYAVKKQ